MRLRAARAARSRRPGCNEILLRDFIDSPRRDLADEGARHREASGAPYGQRLRVEMPSPRSLEHSLGRKERLRFGTARTLGILTGLCSLLSLAPRAFAVVKQHGRSHAASRCCPMASPHYFLPKPGERHLQ
jgi:hypothetical protein